MTTQTLLFTEDELIHWKAEWHNMPEFNHEDLSPRFQVVVSFACEADLKAFAELVEQSIPPSKQKERGSIWFPSAEIDRLANKRYIAP